MTLRIEGADNVVLDGGNQTQCFNILNGTISIHNIKFQNFNGGTGGVICSRANNTIISNNTFSSNHAKIGGAVYIN